MSADIVNLRHARKQKARAEKADTAAENRLKHGRSKAGKKRDAAESELTARRLDQLKRDDQGDQ
jgi:hypothetical protein